MPPSEEQERPVALMVVDDQAVVRDALAIMLDLAVDISRGRHGRHRGRGAVRHVLTRRTAP